VSVMARVRRRIGAYSHAFGSIRLKTITDREVVHD